MIDVEERCRQAGEAARRVGQHLVADQPRFIPPPITADITATRTRHRWRVAVWAVGATALIGVAVVVGRDGHPTVRSVTVPSADASDPSDTSIIEPSTTPPPATTTAATPTSTVGASLVQPSIEASIAVPDGRMAIAEAGGRIWVGSQDNAQAGSHIVGIDPATNSIVATIDRSQTFSMASGFGSLWACSPASLARIDPSTATITALFPVGCYSGLTVGFGSVWVESGRTTLTRLDPSSGAVIATVTLPDAGWGLAAGPDSIWAANGGGGPGHVSRIDPTTNSIIASIAVPIRTRNIVADDKGVWLSSEPGSAVGDKTSTIRIDPVTNTIVQRYANNLDGIGIDRAGPFLWVVGYGGPVAVIDTRTDQTVVSTSRLVPAGLALGGDRLIFAAGSIWITEQRPGTVIRVDPGSFASAATPPAQPTTPTEHPGADCARSAQDLARVLYAHRDLDLPPPTCTPTAGVTTPSDGPCWTTCANGDRVAGFEIETAPAEIINNGAPIGWTITARVSYHTAHGDFRTVIERITFNIRTDGALAVSAWDTIPTDSILWNGATAVQQYVTALAAGQYTKAASLLGNGGTDWSERSDLAPLGQLDPTKPGDLANALHRYCNGSGLCTHPIVVYTAPTIDGTAADVQVAFRDATHDTTGSFVGTSYNGTPAVVGLPPIPGQ